jgi:hypothetical protein
LAPARSNFIYDQSNYWEPLENDLRNAREMIWISSASLTIRAIHQLEEAISSNSQDLKSKLLIAPLKYLDETCSEKPELTIKMNDIVKKFLLPTQPSINFHCNAVIVDQRILWYGSLAPLGFGNENDSIMRIESPRLSIDMQSILIDNRLTNDPSPTPGS